MAQGLLVVHSGYNLAQGIFVPGIDGSSFTQHNPLTTRGRFILKKEETPQWVLNAP